MSVATRAYGTEPPGTDCPSAHRPGAAGDGAAGDGAAGDGTDGPGTGVRAGFARTLVAGVGRPGPGTVQLVTRVLGALVADAEPPGHAPIVLAATDHCLRAVAEFVATCEDTTRRLRPSVSLALEPSLLLGRFTVEQEWAAPCYALVTPGGAGASALRWATAAVRGGTVPAAVVCEVVHGQRAGEETVLAVAALIGPGGAPTAGVRALDPDRDMPAGLDSVLLRAARGEVAGT
ncbi:hypothetical protein [Streptomyces lunaelactis]|uniref:hypothetical protein n=1 Tax=Streptomyces lunaelactis TaxID=1535768 RepID=UPI001584A7FE|nr:hypothetical protein [Streptomyces lunaelactis]NUK00704.1 hypothetical protein [Streptomyces lunaelactis]NUK14424.1 hypothetical protein [Streptomyces lunaelactis]